MGIVQHLNYVAARAQLARALDAAVPGRMIFLIGPSGVGKSTVRHAALRKVFGSPENWLPGKIPVIHTMAQLPTDSFFSSRALVNQFIQELDAPNLSWFDGKSKDRHASIFRAEAESTRGFWDGVRKGIREADAWAVLGRLLEGRGCGVVSIDQVTALLKNRKNKSPTDHTLQLMNFAEMVGITFLMTGTPEAAALWHVYPELRRRVDLVFMRPYSANEKGDRNEFARLLLAMQKRFPGVDRKLLLSMDAEILAATGGVLGELENLLGRARDRAGDAGRTMIGRSDLEESYLTKRDLEDLWEGIAAFDRCREAGSVAVRAAEIRRVWA